MKTQKEILDHIQPRKMEVPDSAYFGQLASKVIASQQPKIVPFYKKTRVWIGAAAAIAVGVVILTTVYRPAENSKDPLIALQEVPEQEIMDYLEEHIEDLDELEIGDALKEASIAISPDKSPETVKTPASEEKEITFDDINANDILNYFNQEGIDPSELEDDDLF